VKIIFDVTCLMPERLSGVGVYAKNLYLSLTAQGAEMSPVIKWSRATKKSFTRNHIFTMPKVYNPVSLPFIKKSKNIFHGPDFRLMTGSARHIRVVTVHDLAVFHEGYNAEAFRERGQHLVKELVAQKPDHIIVDAHFVADELKNRFPEIADRVSAIYLGADHMASSLVPMPSQEIYKDGGYFLYVGHIEKRKNVERIVEAFDLLAAKNKNVRLVIVGKDGHDAETIHARIKASPFRERIEVLGFVSQRALPKIYAGALGFLFPSNYEGFGFPTLEAMSFACPVITSSHGTMKEVAGEAALFADANSAESIFTHMEKLLNDTGLRSDLIHRGLIHVAGFKWKKTADQYMDLYRSLGAR
jgi:alpha-1,3-rhamnosyl/mannosyltransferase